APQLPLGELCVLGDVALGLRFGEPLIKWRALRRNPIGEAYGICFAIIHADHGGHHTVAPSVHERLYGFLRSYTAGKGGNRASEASSRPEAYATRFARRFGFGAGSMSGTTGGSG